ncbi:hypothetical protein BP5796_07528 [Coleophoma crateriformis]|uniref:Uncharacterized protein n=1 Tax=Coleophoma crateriformis TaxID=565419 RepID=A0A3D8RJF0_9HELO|nr:hypothetical protein BP5796_07528 [Coleophoma crateriformis]
MPKFPKGFGRRKSTANALEDLENLPAVAEPSFKVFERPVGGTRSFDGGIKLTTNSPGRPLTSPKHKEDSVFADIKGNRGSGGSNTNTISTIDNSSRLSAASTAPSSTHETNSNEDWKSPHDKPFHDIPMPPVPKTSSAFSLKNAGRTVSWGRSKATVPSPSLKAQDHPQSPDNSPSPIEDETFGRQRTVTASSYASTATPPKLDERELALNLGGGFDSDMFAGIGKRKSAILDGENLRGMSASPEYYSSKPMALPAASPAGRAYPARPSPLHIDKKRDIEPSPYSWSSQHSHDGLMAQPLSPPPPVPVHAPQMSRSIDSLPSVVPRPQRPGGITDVGVRRTSAFSARRQSTLSYGDGVDEDARLLRESANASRQLGEDKGRENWMQRASPDYSTKKYDDAGSDSAEPTPRAKVQPKPQAEPEPETAVQDEDLFEQTIDPHVAEVANIALQFEEKPISPPTQFTPQMKVMTPAQFERYKQDQDRLRSVGGGIKDDDEDEEEEEEEEEDEIEKNRQLAKQRRKQEAHMAVYRQQMMKMTGETPAPKPNLATQSTPNLLMNGKPEEGEEEDEEVPLAILAAHGFPNKNKPPNPQLNSMGSNPNLRAAAQSTGNAGGNLPVFARNLPQDPYLGAGLVHPTNRESLAFGNGSLHGGPARHLPPPGGLVGVIAEEERSRALRRGSPNTNGDYGGMPGNGFSGMGMPSPGMMGMNAMGQPMMLTPGDQAQIQMTQQMQQFMQMQMQFMQMMTSGPAMQQQQQPQPNATISRPYSSHLQPGQPGTPNLRPASAHQGRTMSMLDPSSASWMQGGPLFAPSIHNQGAGYAPSIAPSERSNIGLPGRYRPVSHLPMAENKSRTSTMTGALQGWENKNASATIRQVRKMKSASDEDDDEGWAQMKAKREKKKTIWRSKKEDNGLKEMVNFAQ